MEAFCPLCGNSRTNFFMKLTQKEEYGFSITEPFYGTGQSLWRCQACGITFTHPLPNEKELLKAYAELKDLSYPEEAGRLKGSQEVLFQLERLLRRRGRLLDVGCFCGLLLSEAQNRGWQVEGIEPSLWAREEARKRFGLVIHHPSLQEATFSASTFDAVTAIDVLEHFLDPKRELHQIRRVLKPGGLLYISTPDIESWSARIFGRRWWGYRQEHLFYFTRPCLRRFLNSFGFELLWEGFYRRIFTIGQLLWRLQGISPWASRLLSPIGKFSLIRDREILTNLYDRIALVTRKVGA